MLLEIGDHLARLHRRGGTNDYVMRNGLGARGIDYVAKTHSSTTTVGFPLYDAHGNNVATLSRNGSGGFNVNDRRAYDAWGVIRQGNTTGDPKGRYCAQLGHVQDDESGLLYMRARYYEPTNGRFVNQDPSRRGTNWYMYCKNDAVNLADKTGCEGEFWSALLFGLGFGLGSMLAHYFVSEFITSYVNAFFVDSIRDGSSGVSRDFGDAALDWYNSTVSDYLQFGLGFIATAVLEYIGFAGSGPLLVGSGPVLSGVIGFTAGFVLTFFTTMYSFLLLAQMADIYDNAIEEFR